RDPQGRCIHEQTNQKGHRAPTSIVYLFAGRRRNRMAKKILLGLVALLAVVALGAVLWVAPEFRQSSNQRRSQSSTYDERHVQRRPDGPLLDAVDHPRPRDRGHTERDSSARCRQPAS